MQRLCTDLFAGTYKSRILVITGFIKVITERKMRRPGRFSGRYQLILCFRRVISAARVSRYERVRDEAAASGRCGW